MCLAALAPLTLVHLTWDCKPDGKTQDKSYYQIGIVPSRHLQSYEG